ncbi:hypothetical protein LCGC14_0909020 [marine sediment metagenome]|uniref:Phage tail tape measure protein domain-containing protein n=1 Tax=marine sediment metagenome TaxID=412755 RepID=A0A0F9RD15_9ZZZZ
MATTEIERLLVRLVGDATSYQKMLRDAQVSAKQAAAVVQSAGQKMEQIAASLKRFGASMSRFGRSLALRVTAPLTIMGGLAVHAFAKFDKAMTESTSIMQTTGNQVEQMRELALELSTRATQGPKDLAESFFFLASAGLDAEASMKALPQVSQFATAGAFDMAEATDLLTDAQQAMGLSSKDADENLRQLIRTSDAFVKANQLANTSVRQISQALTADAGTAAKDFGQSLETTVAVLSAYASAGKKGAEAGNLFGRATRLLTSAQMKNAAEFEKRGIRVINEATGEFSNFIDIIADMEKSFKGLTKPEIKKALSNLGFEALAQKSLAPLIGLSETMKDYEKQIISAGGATKEVADKQMKSFSNQLKILKNQLTVVRIGIGETLAPMITKLSGYIKDGISYWRKLSLEVKRTAVIISVVAAAIGPLLIAFGSLIRIVGFSVLGLRTLRTVVLSTKAAMLRLVSIGVVGFFIALRVATAGLRKELEGVVKSNEKLLRLQSKRIQVMGGIEDPAKRIAALRQEQKRLLSVVQAVQRELNSAQKQLDPMQQPAGLSRMAANFQRLGTVFGIDPTEGAEANLESAEQSLREANDALESALASKSTIEKESLVSTKQVLDMEVAARRKAAEESKQLIKSLEDSLLKSRFAAAVGQQAQEASQAEQIRRQFLPPKEVFKEKIKELEHLLEVGAFGKGFKAELTFVRAFKGAEKALADALKPLEKNPITIPIRFQIVTGVGVGSAEDISRIAEFRLASRRVNRKADRRTPVLDAAEQQSMWGWTKDMPGLNGEEAKKHTDLLVQIRDALEDRETIELEAAELE